MKRGFTLIELLVVVLIIGILSAVALPQYTVAVEKARMSEVFQNVASLQRALNIYVMENGFDTENFDVDSLSIDFSHILDCEEDGKQCSSKYFTYEVGWSREGFVIFVERIQDSRQEYDLQYNQDISNGQWSSFCGLFDKSSEYSKKICKSLWSQGWGEV